MINVKSCARKPKRQGIIFYNFCIILLLHQSSWYYFFSLKLGDVFFFFQVARNAFGWYCIYILDRQASILYSFVKCVNSLIVTHYYFNSADVGLVLLHGNCLHRFHFIYVCIPISGHKCCLYTVHCICYDHDRFSFQVFNKYFRLFAHLFCLFRTK